MNKVINIGTVLAIVVSFLMYSNTKVQAEGSSKLMLDEGLEVIELDLAEAEVTIRPSDEAFVLIERVSDKKDLKIKESYKDKKLTLSTKNKFLGLISLPKFNKKEKAFEPIHRITINIPTDKLKSLKIKQATGSLYAERLDVLNCDIKLDTGEINLDDSVINEIGLDISAGKVKLKKVNVNDVKAKVKAGSLSLEGDIVNKGHIKTDIGIVKLDLARSKDKYLLSTGDTGKTADKALTPLILSNDLGQVEVNYSKE